MRNEYEIEISFDEGHVERSFAGRTASETESGEHYLSLDEEQQISAAYGTDVRHEDGKSVVSARFVDTMPIDVGGAGYVHIYHSPMGQVGVYLERFRGSDDLVSRFDRMQQAVDQLVELARLWVRAEGRDTDVARRIEAYVTGDARRDLKNLCLIVWTVVAGAEFHDEEATQAEVLARVVQYAVEQEFIELEDVPKIHRLARATPETALLLFRKLLAKRFATDVDSLVRSFPALASPSELEASKRRLAFLLQLASEEMIDEAVSDCLPFSLSTSDQLTVRFRLPQRPFSCNGKQLEDGSVEWAAILSLPDDPRSQVLPTQVFAAWSEPDERYQKLRFGRVLLTGRELADYVLWYRGLCEAEGREWDAFLADVTPDDDLPARLEEFRFTSEAASLEDQTSLLAEPRRLFQAALSPDSD